MTIETQSKTCRLPVKMPAKSASLTSALKSCHLGAAQEHFMISGHSVGDGTPSIPIKADACWLMPSNLKGIKII